MTTEQREDGFADRLAQALDAKSERAGSFVGAATDDLDVRTAAVLAQLRAPSTWAEPPADLRARILVVARAEAAAPGAPVVPASDPTAVAPVTPLVPRWRRLAVVVPVAAVAAVALTVGVLAMDAAVEQPERGTTSTVAGTLLAPQAAAEVSVTAAAAGFALVVDARELPAAASGSYYAAFLSGPRGVVPLGSFHGRGVDEPIRLWSGVDPADYPKFTVTLQREGGPVEPSELVVLIGSLSG